MAEGSRRLCSRCVLPESPPDVVLGAGGVCNICAAHVPPVGQASGELPEAEFLKTIARGRGRGRYDCLLMCSGGKDSCMALHQTVRRYKLNPLVFTFDHSFENEAALANVRSAVGALGVDWLYFRSQEIKEIFRKLLAADSRAPICHVCAIWYTRETFALAARYGIRVIIGGWTVGQASLRGEGSPEFASMSSSTTDFVEKELRPDPRWRDFPRSMKEAAAAAPRGLTAVSPHWFLRHDPGRAVELLEKELGWKRTDRSYPKGSTNCLLNFLSVDRTLARFGYTHYHAELSRLIRLGELSREEALEMLVPDYGEAVVREVLSGLGCGEGGCAR